MSPRQEQKALVALFGVLVLLVVGILAYLLLTHRQDDAPSPADTARQDQPHGTQTTAAVGHDTPAPSPASIPFDPNTADSATLVAVGLSPFQARNVLRYRRKGGQYHRPQDLKRLYGLTVAQWQHLEPLIHIGRQYQYLADVEDVSPAPPTARRPHPIDTTSHPTHPLSPNHTRDKIHEGEHIDIAHCDTTQLQRIPGIGSYYARRILQYSERLGGFVSLDQLNDDELSFLPMGVERYMTVGSTATVRKLRINQLTMRQLSHHPYITHAQARQIVNRVRLNGPFRSWDELLFLPEFTEADRQRLEPYVEF